MNVSTKPKHVWEAVGFTCDTFEPNIWRCPYCGTHKSVARKDGNRINPGLTTEFTDEDGGILQPLEARAVPPCIPKEMPTRERPVKGVEEYGA